MFKGHSDERTPSDQGDSFSQRCPIFPMLKHRYAMKGGHLACRDTFSGIFKTLEDMFYWS